MIRRLSGMIRKEFIQFSRDKALSFLIVYTFLEIAICGWALTLEVKDLPSAVYDGDHSTQSRDLVEAFARLDNFNLISHVDDPSTLEQLMDSGKVQFALIVPRNFGRDVNAGTPTQVQVLIDGTNSNTAGQAMAIMTSLLQNYNARVAETEIERTGFRGLASLPQVKNLVRIWYIPDLKYVYYIMLTMLTITVLILGVLLPSASIVREKVAGTFEQLMVTPVTGLELVIAKIVPMILLKTVGLTLGVGLSIWIFDVPLRGSLLLFYGISLLMFLSSMGIGVLIGTFTENMQQTLMIFFFIFFPLAFLSGTMVPVSNMPRLLQWLTYLSPLRHYVDATLGIFLKGVGLDVLWPQVLALSILGFALLGFGTLRLRRILA